ncbi:MAG: GH3 auxin-responsive promoter family protein [Candidatus Omnitrophica bacterium]|nr:GH3 auxin-responsive promoter family protein [Candidatus Omnitrophota bacterium]
MNIAYLFAKTLALKAKAFEKATKDPILNQKKVLLEYLRRNKNTEYGKKFGFSRIRSIADYQKTVPMSDCTTLRPYIDKMREGATNILTSDKTIFFGTTTGTTSIPKLIPVTEYSRRKKAEIQDLWAYYIIRDHPDILDGKILAIVGSEIEYFTETGIPCGAESGHGYKNLLFVIRPLYVLPPQIFDIVDYESRYYCTLRIAMTHNITTIAALSPSTIILLCQKITLWKKRLINDIRKGTLDPGINIPKDIRRSIERSLRPKPKRAKELENILKEKKELLPKYFWPNLKLIECWKAGMSKLYLKELPFFFGNVPIRDFGCLSTEARSSIPISDTGAGGILAIKTNFYEFVPKEDMCKSVKRFLLCNEIEKGKEYFLIVTTPGGFFRYHIDDIITVVGFFNKTPMIEFVQKGLSASSLVGEKLYESHVIEAVNSAVDEHGLILKFFSASVQHNIPSRYIFLVEFGIEPSREKKKAFLDAIEKGLYKQNTEYESKRMQQLLAPPILKVVKEGEFEKYRAKRTRAGAHDGQFKVPELNPSPDFQNNFAIKEEISM